MPKRSKRESSHVEADAAPPAAEVFSFLKEMSGEISWTLADLKKALKVSETEARRITAIFEIQGYIKARGNNEGDNGEWITTESGQEVSGAKFPRFTPDHVEQSLKSLRERIATVNRDRQSAFHVTEAVAFGDFLRGGSRVQAADVGIALQRRDTKANSARTNRTAAAQFLKSLRGRITALNLKPFEAWMAARSHRRLI
jgi:hypothetical protein